MTTDSPGTICVFAKPPRAGEVKTRLSSLVGSEGAAMLAAAFLEDTWNAVPKLAWARPVLAAASFGPELTASVSEAEIWMQGFGDLGERIERVLARALESAPFAIALGTDTPGLPPKMLEDARRALETSDAVIGPAEDGGFYLLGLRRCPSGLLRDLPWSAETTFTRTLRRLRERGLTTTVLLPWFDVDRPSDLLWLASLLGNAEISAPATARALETLLTHERPSTSRSR